MTEPEWKPVQMAAGTNEQRTLLTVKTTNLLIYRTARIGIIPSQAEENYWSFDSYYDVISLHPTVCVPVLIYLTNDLQFSGHQLIAFIFKPIYKYNARVSNTTV